MIDYHIHTHLCNHATGMIEEYVAAALQNGLHEIGFSDHGPMNPWYDPASRMTLQQFDSYHEMVHRVKKAFENDLSIKLGIEMDYFHGTESFVQAFLAEHEFDYVLGSVHYLEDWNFDHPNFIGRYDIVGVDFTYLSYYRLLKEAAASGFFDILAHFDLPKKFGHRPTAQFDAQIEEILRIVSENDLCIEVNTSGLRRPIKEIYPAPAILQRIHENQIPIVMGSDAHEPGQVGFAFDTTIPLLQAIGFTGVMQFENRKAHLHQFK